MLVTAEIFLIWTYVTRMNVELTSITIKVGSVKVVPGTYLKKVVNIGSVTVEIFLIWTNVARTNVISGTYL